MPSKLDYLLKKNLNPADELRGILDYLEELQPVLGKLHREQALGLLKGLDKCTELFSELEMVQINLAPEYGRYHAFIAHFRRKLSPVLKAMGGPAALAEVRPKPAPDRERWWWYIHEDVAIQQQQTLRRVAKGILIILLVIGLIGVLFQTVLAPTPEAIARVQAENDAFTAFAEGNAREALTAIEAGLTVVPTDPGLLILQGIFQELTGQDEAAAESFAAAKENVEDPSMFYLGRGQMYFRTTQFDKAEVDARTVLELDDSSATAWLLLGQALEFQGRRMEAIPAYQQAGDLGLETGESQIVVLARMALGRMTGGGP